MFNLKVFIGFCSLFVFACLQSASAQIIVDASVKKQYDSIYQNLPGDIKQKVEERNASLLKLYNEHKKEMKKGEEFRPFTYAIVTENETDTLNIKDFQGTPSNVVKEKSLFLVDAAFRSDSFAIVLTPGAGRSSEIDIVHLIKDGHLSTKYFEWRDTDTIFRTILKSKPSNVLELTATSSTLRVSDNIYKVNKALYGYAEVIMKPFYEENKNFEKGYIIKQLRFKYYFKVVPHKSEEDGE
ncbi:hypothetical protein ACI6Q2_14865 [Chitinophagaceae bacterium LWZ2-11]